MCPSKNDSHLGRNNEITHLKFGHISFDEEPDFMLQDDWKPKATDARISVTIQDRKGWQK
jgi:hypothetical protein